MTLLWRQAINNAREKVVKLTRFNNSFRNLDTFVHWAKVNTTWYDRCDSVEKHDHLTTRFEWPQIPFFSLVNNRDIFPPSFNKIARNSDITQEDDVTEFHLLFFRYAIHVRHQRLIQWFSRPSYIQIFLWKFNEQVPIAYQRTLDLYLFYVPLSLFRLSVRDYKV